LDWPSVPSAAEDAFPTTSSLPTRCPRCLGVEATTQLLKCPHPCRAHCEGHPARRPEHRAIAYCRGAITRCLWIRRLPKPSCRRHNRRPSPLQRSEVHSASRLIHAWAEEASRQRASRHRRDSRLGCHHPLRHSRGTQQPRRRTARGAALEDRLSHRRMGRNMSISAALGRPLVNSCSSGHRSREQLCRSRHLPSG